MRTTRRAVVGSLAGVALAGCLGLQETDDAGDPDDGNRSDAGGEATPDGGEDAGEAQSPTPSELDPLDVTEGWHREAAVGDAGHGTIFGAELLVATAAGPHRLVRYDRETGDPRWETDLDAPVPETADALSATPTEGAIAVGDAAGTVTLVDADDGSVRWSTAVDEPTIRAVVATDDAVVVAWQGSDAETPAGVDCLERADGSRRWSLSKADVEDEARISTVLLSTLSPPYDGVVEVGGWNGGFAVDVADGNVLDDVRAYTTQPVVAADALYVRKGTGEIDRFDLPDRTAAWSAEPIGRANTDPAVDDDVVCFGADDHGLYGVERASGDRRWRYQTDGEVATRPSVYDGLAWTVSWGRNDRLIAVDVDDGTPVGTVTFENDRIHGHGVVDGALYVRSAGGLRRLERP